MNTPPSDKPVFLPLSLPSREQCLTILEEAGCEIGVIEHCLAVESLSLLIGQRCGGKINLAVLCAGALLHDVGRSVTHDVQHVIRGVEILKALGIDLKVVNIVKKHIGAGLTREDAHNLGFPDDDYMPSTLEEKIVAHADNLVGDPSSPDRRKTRAEMAQEFLDKGLPEAAKRGMALHDELSAICGIDLDQLITPKS